MDAVRYAKVRELFLEADELAPGERLAFLESKVGDDKDLLSEVLSLLDEHDAESAQLEGEMATPVQPPPSAMAAVVAEITRTGPAPSKPAPSDSGESDSPGPLSASRPLSGSRPLSPAGESSGKSDHDRSSQITQTGAQRTHASPRYSNESTVSPEQQSAIFWKQKTRRNRRLNSGWLWLAAVLPTALIGWWTFQQVASAQRAAIQNELSGLVNSVTLSTVSFLNDRARLVESWSRQPAIRQSIIELVEIAKQDDATEALKKASQTELIRQQLQELSGFEGVKYMVWDLSQITLASWREDRSDVGQLIPQSGAAALSNVWRNNTVLYGPGDLHQIELPETGFKEASAKTGDVLAARKPVMVNIVPIRDARDKVVAALMVRGIQMFDDFDKMFREASTVSGLDVYAIDRREVMLTNSPVAVRAANILELETPMNQIASKLRVSDPGFAIRPSNIGEIRRSTMPLTYAAAGAMGGREGVRTDEYLNYSGVPVLGAWRWSEKWEVGVIVEHNSKTAFAPTRIVRFGFLLLGALLTLTAFAAASQIAKQTSRAHASIHPLSRYELISELGSGGMGVVYRAKHRQLGRDTALKVLRSDRQNKEDRLRFDREAKLAAKLSNPHSVMIYDYGRSEEGAAFCVMEYLQGITLYEVVMRSGFQSVGRTLFILRQICESLGEAHATGLMHRDIKPQNVMLSLDKSVGDWAVVFDFGLAKPLHPDGSSYQTSETVWSGTPMYMSPERYRDPAGMDPRSDIYSLGCIAYFLLSGRPPYAECDPESLFALVLSEQPIGIPVHRGERISQSVLDMVDRCMAKDANDRFKTIEELAAVLDELRAVYPWTTEQASQWWDVHGEDEVIV